MGDGKGMRLTGRGMGGYKLGSEGGMRSIKMNFSDSYPLNPYLLHAVCKYSKNNNKRNHLN